MKISELELKDICTQVRLLEEELDEQECRHLDAIKAAAIAYVSGYTGIPGAELDSYPDITIAVLVLISDMYDNRQMYVDRGNVNRVVESILNMHRINLIPGEVV